MATTRESDMVITPEAAAEALRQGREEEAFWAEHEHEYQEKFGDQFVAVSRSKQTTVLSHANLPSLARELRSRGISLQDVWIRFIPAQAYELVL